MQLSGPLALAPLAVALGSALPVPAAGAGTVIWSSTAGVPLVWNGNYWAAFGPGLPTSLSGLPGYGLDFGTLDNPGNPVISFSASSTMGLDLGVL